MLRLAAAIAALACTATPSLAQQTAMTPMRDDVRFEARPTPADARNWASDGHTTVINLLTAPEIEALDFDYAGMVMENGMVYANVPVGQMTGSEAADAVARILADTEGPVVINCGSSVRASHVYAAAQIRAGHITRDQLHLVDPGREWNQAFLSRLLGEAGNAESSQ